MESYLTTHIERLCDFPITKIFFPDRKYSNNNYKYPIIAEFIRSIRVTIFLVWWRNSEFNSWLLSENFVLEFFHLNVMQSPITSHIGVSPDSGTQISHSNIILTITERNILAWTDKGVACERHPEETSKHPLPPLTVISPSQIWAIARRSEKTGD